MSAIDTASIQVYQRGRDRRWTAQMDAPGAFGEVRVTGEAAAGVFARKLAEGLAEVAQMEAEATT